LKISEIQWMEFIKKWGISIVLFPFFLLYTLHFYRSLTVNIFISVHSNFPFPAGFVYIVIDSISLIIHEAGHSIFRIFGIRFLTILGGTLMQLLIPGLLLFYAWIRRHKPGLQLSLAFLGYNLMDISVYAADASARQLPLIGNLPKTAHDWFNMLWQMGILQYDHAIGMVFFFFGVGVFILALGIPILIKNYEVINLELNV